MFSSVCLALHKHSFKHLHMEQQRGYTTSMHTKATVFLTRYFRTQKKNIPKSHEKFQG